MKERTYHTDKEERLIESPRWSTPKAGVNGRVCGSSSVHRLPISSSSDPLDDEVADLRSWAAKNRRHLLQAESPAVITVTRDPFDKWANWLLTESGDLFFS